jgi:Uncharacterized protein involved in formate dehydrogenase formation
MRSKKNGRNIAQIIKNNRGKSANPHYTDLLDIMADILILREEYRNSMKDSIFCVEENLITQKMEGGLPLIDFTGKEYDLTRPKEYFNSLISIAEKRMPEVAQNIISIIKSPEFDWEKMIRASFDGKVEETAAQGLLAGREAEENIDLIDLFTEESLRPELESIAEKYGEIVGKSNWSEGYCPICGKEPKIGEIREEEEGKRYLFCHQCGFKWYFHRIKCPFCGNEEQHSLLILKWKARSVIEWMSVISAGAISKPLNCLSQVKIRISTLKTLLPCIWI